MLHRPQFKPCFQVESVPREATFLLSERHSLLLAGEVYPQLVPLIDGQRTSDEIAKALEGQLSAVVVYYTLAMMEKQGYLVEAETVRTDDRALFWQTLDFDSDATERRLAAARVAIATVGELAAEPLRTAMQGALEAQQIAVGEGGNFRLILTDDYLREELADRNREALQTGQTWMLAKPVGVTLWLGPIFVPGQTGCWECLAQRLRGNRPVEAFIAQKTGRWNYPDAIASPATLQIAWGAISGAIARWLAGEGEHPLLGKLTTLDTQTLSSQEHFLTKRPQCRACGDPGLVAVQTWQPIALQPCPKTFTSDGGHRSVSPDVTLQRYESQVSPLLGVVRRLHRNALPGESDLVQNYATPHAWPVSDLAALRENVWGRSGGKGMTQSQAKASGLCEAIERYSGCFQGDEVRQRASYLELGELAIHPNDCMLFSPTQYQRREEMNAKGDLTQKIPEPFEPDRPLDWTPVWSLSEQVFKYFPTACCYYGYPESEARSCLPDSNGCAAGNTREEAILQGFLELVERDCVALWWYNRLPRPAVDLASFGNPYFLALIENYRADGRQLWVLDITNDLNIPAFAAIAPLTDSSDEEICLGFGAHFDANIALSRALTEASQVRVLFQGLAARSEGDRSPHPIPEIWKTVTVADCPYLRPNPQATPKTLADYPQNWQSDIQRDILNAVAIARGAGLEVLVLDQTRPDISLSVMKVIVPGLRHFWTRFAPGRLYAIPVELGWLSAPNSEAQLNPIPMWL